ncbi:hypothetical protein AAKU67_002642 [Oxalobacteraceae bacterium GrIS 2.11]
MLPTSSASQIVMKNTLSTILPMELINIVDSYFAFSDATAPLVLGSDGKPVDSELNRTTIESIKLAFSSPQCDRDIIRLIFSNAAENGYIATLNDLINGLRLTATPVILDNVNFSGLNLSGVNLNSASIRGANFTGCCLNDASFIASDLASTEGLTQATDITVNSLTVLTDTGLYSDSTKLALYIETNPCMIALSGPGRKIDYLSMTLGSTRFLIRYCDTVARP